MIFRAITSTGDWLFGKGINDYFTDEKAINANIQTRLQSWVNDCFFALSDGIDWSSRLDVGQQTALVEELKSNILNAFGVVGINSVESHFNGITRFITIQYNIQTIFSPSFQGSLIISAGSGV